GAASNAGSSTETSGVTGESSRARSCVGEVVRASAGPTTLDVAEGPLRCSGAVAGGGAPSGTTPSAPAGDAPRGDAPRGLCAPGRSARIPLVAGEFEARLLGVRITTVDPERGEHAYGRLLGAPSRRFAGGARFELGTGVVEVVAGSTGTPP